MSSIVPSRIGASGRCFRPLIIAAIVVVAAGAGASRAGAQGVATPSPTPVRIVDEVKTDPKDSGWDKLASLAQGLAALIALGTAPILIRQLMTARKDSRDKHALEFNERYTSREFRAVASRTTAFLDAAHAGDCVEKLHAWYTAPWAEHQCLPRTPRMADPDPSALPAPNDIQQVLGFFEALGTVYNSGDLTPKVVLDTIATPPVQMLTIGWWFICWRRGGELCDETELYKQYEILVRDIREKRPSLGKAQPKANIRILCLPKRRDKAPEQDWERCARLSRALSKRVAATPGGDVRATRTVIGRLLKDVDALAAHGPPGRKCELTMLAIPREIKVSVEAWKPVREQVIGAAHRVSGLGEARLDALLRRLAA